MNKLLSVISICVVIAGSSQAVVYTWNGSAADGNWSNSLNWVDGLAPASLSSENTTPDTIIFDGENMPVVNVASFLGGYGNASDNMLFNSGGTFNLDLSTSANAGVISSTDRTFLTVGDGVGGGTDNVVVNINNMGFLSRHTTSTQTYAVNSDGTLIINGNLTLYGDHAKDVIFNLQGGSLVATGNVPANWNQVHSNGIDTYQDSSYFLFNAEGSSFTAAYGGIYGTLADVETDTYNHLREGSGITLEYTDNGSSFTVTAIPEPATIGLIAAFGGGLLFVRRRFLI